jgi:hypothetical protein
MHTCNVSLAWTEANNNTCTLFPGAEIAGEKLHTRHPCTYISNSVCRYTYNNLYVCPEHVRPLYTHLHKSYRSSPSRDTVFQLSLIGSKPSLMHYRLNFRI